MVITPELILAELTDETGSGSSLSVSIGIEAMLPIVWFDASS